MSTIPSFVKYTNDFLQKLTSMETFPEGAILVSLDAVGLYPHIPHAEGLEAIRHALNERENQETPTRGGHGDLRCCGVDVFLMR